MSTESDKKRAKDAAEKLIDICDSEPEIIKYLWETRPAQMQMLIDRLDATLKAKQSATTKEVAPETKDGSVWTDEQYEELFKAMRKDGTGLTYGQEQFIKRVRK